MFSLDKIGGNYTTLFLFLTLKFKKLVKNNMARHKVPSYVKFLDEFPTTASGKIQKFKLREMGIKLLSLQQATNIETA